MKSRTLILLAVVVIGLGWYAQRTFRSEQQSLADADVRLFSGLDENLVTVVRIENVMRDLHMRFERDAAGVWSLTDPVAARAEQGAVELVVQAALRARGPLVGEDEARAPALLGLDPPRFVLELGEGTGSRQRAEFGAVELDGTRMFARIGDQYVRVSREIEPMIARELHEFRASSISTVDPRLVIEVHRRGSGPSSETGLPFEASFDATLVDGAWRATAPVAGLLDPAGMALFVQSCATYRFESIFDEGARSLNVLGLDPPELTVEIGTTGTEVVTILLGRPGRTGSWLGTRAGSRTVWPISETDVGFFATSVFDLLDHKLVRGRRGSFTKLEIDSAAGRVRLVRGARGWTCAAARAGSDVFGLESAAEARAVEDVIGALERYELTGFLADRTFEPGSSPVRWRVEGEGGPTGGSFGAAHVDAAGSSDVLFQRDGETAVGHSDPRILDVLARDPALFLSLRLLESNEVDLRAIRIRRDALERHFERNVKGMWTRAGGEVEARELRPLLDAILFLRASVRVAEAGRAPLEDVIDLEYSNHDGASRSARIGFTTIDGVRRVEIDVDGGRGVAHDQALHEKIAALLAGG